MRTGQFLKERNIAFHTVILLCSYHNLESPNINRKLTKGQIELFDLTLSKPEFEELYKIKKQQIANAIFKLKNLETSNETSEIIIDSVNLLLSHNYFSIESATKLKAIITSSINNEEKSFLIKEYRLSIKKLKEESKRVKHSIKTKNVFKEDVIFLNDDNSWKSAYGNSYEAYVAHWNTD